jgi:hypothetical protein
MVALTGSRFFIIAVERAALIQKERANIVRTIRVSGEDAILREVVAKKRNARNNVLRKSRFEKLPHTTNELLVPPRQVDFKT